MKIHSEFVCQQCGYRSASFLGKCPNCGEWNSLVEQIAQEQKSESRIQQAEVELVRLAEVKSQKFPRIATGFLEFDRVLGGGIVPGSIVLIAGDPGIGKSTLLLQTAMVIARGPVSRFLPASARSGLKPFHDCHHSQNVNCQWSNVKCSSLRYRRGISPTGQNPC